MGSSRINAVRQRLAFDIDTGYDEVMTDAAELKSSRNLQQAYDPKTKRYTEKGRKFCRNCDPVSQSLFKKLGGADKGYNVVEGSFIYGEGQARNHRWVRDDQGTIYDASREQFGDTLKVHKINPRDPKYKKYMEDHVLEGNTPLGGEKLYELGLNTNKRKTRFNRRYDLRHDQIFNEGTGKTKPLGKTITKGMKAIFGKSARIQTARQRLADIFDVIEGGGKIKRTEYEDDEEILPRRKEGYGWEGTELMEPEDFLDKAQTIDPNVFRRMHYKKRPWNTGPKTNLGDVHSNFLTDDPKSEFYRGVSNFQWGETHQMDKLEDLEDREIFRGDELGDVEFYKRKIRRGDPIEVPELHHQRNKTIGHEGRHRARALLEEGEEYIPVKGVSVDDTYGGEFEYEGLEDLEGEPTSYQKEKPKFRPKYKSPIGLGKSARIQMARERLGAVGNIKKIKEPKPYPTKRQIDTLKGMNLREFDIHGVKLKKPEELFNTDVTNFTGKHFLSPEGKISKASSFHQNQLDEYGIEHSGVRSWLKDSGSVRIKADIRGHGFLNVENHTKLTEPQIEQIARFINEHRLEMDGGFAHDNFANDFEGSDEIVKRVGTLAKDYGGSYSFAPEKQLKNIVKRQKTQPKTQRTHTQNIIGEPLTEEQLRESKLRQRIAGLGFRERILNWLREQPRFKSFDPDSSFVGTVKYDQDNQTMQIELNGKKYDFCNVEERLFDSFSGAGSKGAFFNREIKSLHNCGAW